MVTLILARTSKWRQVIKKISDEAEASAKKILLEAEEEAGRILSEYKKKVAELEASEKKKIEKAVSEDALRRESGAALESRKALLSKKQELISKAFDLAYEKLSALSGEDLCDMILSLALVAADGRGGEIILSAGDKEAIGKKLSEKLSENSGIAVSEEVRESGGGFIFKRGDTEVNCTFRALCDEKRSSMSREIADILFGQRGDSV